MADMGVKAIMFFRIYQIYCQISFTNEMKCAEKDYNKSVWLAVFK